MGKTIMKCERICYNNKLARFLQKLVEKAESDGNRTDGLCLGT